MQYRLALVQYILALVQYRLALVQYRLTQVHQMRGAGVHRMRSTTRRLARNRSAAIELPSVAGISNLLTRSRVKSASERMVLRAESPGTGRTEETLYDYQGYNR